MSVVLRQDSNAPFARGVPCPQCTRVYKNKNSLHFHLRYDCGETKNYNCDISDKEWCQSCDRYFKNRNSLAVHISRDCGKSKEHALVCPNCFKLYKNPKCLSVHKAQDCGKGKTFICSLCFREFRRKSQLKVHLKSRHGTPNFCKMEDTVGLSPHLEFMKQEEQKVVPSWHHPM
ncbi:zinc finger and BTB domain-containing protein 24-like [Euwallacea similis]|uniref:zinc finger and BTB domain-containing protein 24-like n=1 Tax=Euwallacea similis TaxID=1736056 RepID=UPI00344B92E4